MHWERYNESLKGYYDISVCSPRKGQFAVMFYDITERKTAEEALFNSHLLLNASRRLSKVGGWEFDVATGTTMWTEELYRLHDLPFDTGIDHVAECLKCYRPEDRFVISNAFKNACEKGVAYDLEFPFTTFKGRPFWVRTTCQPFYENGKVVRLIGNLMDITERKRTEIALHESEEQRHILEQMEVVQAALDGFWMVNASNGRILEVNDNYCKQVGYSSEEILNMHISELDANESAEDVQKHIQLIKDKGYDRFETRHRHKSGQLIDLEVSVSRSDVHGGVNFAFFHDISDRKNAERFKQSILNSISEEIAVLDRNGVIVAVNQTWRQFALDNCAVCDTLEARTACANLLPCIDVGTNYLTACQSSTDTIIDGAQDPIQGIRAVLDGQLPTFSYEYPCHSPQQQRWFRMNVTPLGDNVQDGVVITHADITQRMRSEESIKQSRDQLKTFIEQAPICVAMFDQGMNYLAASGRWMEEYGRGHANLIGLNHYVVHPDVPDNWKTVHQQALAGAALENKEDMWIQGDGSKHWLRWAVHPWINESKEVGGIIISAEDITDTKLLEMKLAERRNEMEELQRHHIASQTASAIAHEINQPLASIAAYSQAGLMMLKPGSPNYDDIRSALERSEQQSLRAGRSIRDLINFLNKEEFPVEPFDFNNEIIDAINAAKLDHNLVFKSILNLEEGLPHVLANRTHVQKVLMNLIHNGIDAMQAAGVPIPAITVSVRTAKDQRVVQMTIQDNGPGIRKEDVDRLFEPFFTTKSKGIGMGLAISRSLIEANGGQLWVDPEEGIGATFHLTLPFAP